MISLDTNLLFFGYVSDRLEHTAAHAFLDLLGSQSDVTISEFVLMELYCLLRNPSVVAHPLGPSDAVAVIQTYRQHPRWTLAGFTTDSLILHNSIWKLAAQPNFAYRRIYDVRLALTLQIHGVTEFATTNVKDFQGLGFQRVWNPLMPT